MEEIKVLLSDKKAFIGEDGYVYIEFNRIKCREFRDDEEPNPVITAMANTMIELKENMKGKYNHEQ